jgi:predicted RNA-binding protein YlqC (UPF0109 family)
MGRTKKRKVSTVKSDTGSIKKVKKIDTDKKTKVKIKTATGDKSKFITKTKKSGKTINKSKYKVGDTKTKSRKVVTKK